MSGEPNIIDDNEGWQPWPEDRSLPPPSSSNQSLDREAESASHHQIEDMEAIPTTAVPRRESRCPWPGGGTATGQLFVGVIGTILAVLAGLGVAIITARLDRICIRERLTYDGGSWLIGDMCR